MLVEFPLRSTNASKLRHKNAVFWDVMPCGSCKNRRSGGTYRSVLQLLVTANVPSSQNLVTLVMQVICSSETAVLTRPTRRNITKYGILHSHRREYLKSYLTLTGWVL
jgi:hypothetical protein